MNIKARVKVQNCSKAINRITRRIERAGSATIEDLAELGKKYAQMRVPKGNTQWLYRSIRKQIINTRSGTEAKIYLEPYYVPNDGVHRGIPTKNSHWKYINFSLARWGEQSPKARHHFRNGSPTFMSDTVKYLNSMTKSVATGRFKSINLK